MKSLNTSLPSSASGTQPPEQLLQSFKTAALSVTNLYKNAVYEQSQAKRAGYQEAIEELLQFLDRENLGLGDGEGWRVRQWATERNDGMGAPPSDDDDQLDSEKRARSATPAAVRRDHPDARRPCRSASPPKDGAPTTQQPAPPTQHGNDGSACSRPAIFTFTSGSTFPQGQDVDMHSNDNPPVPSQDESGVSLPALPRHSRQHHRHGNFSRSNPRAPTREPSVGIGSKRKLAFPDFFDLSGTANGRDMFGGGKRGRYS